MESWYRLKVQEIQTQSARQTMEQGYAKEEIKRLRVQLTDLRGKLADLEGRVSTGALDTLTLSRIPFSKNKSQSSTINSKTINAIMKTR